MRKEKNNTWGKAYGQVEDHRRNQLEMRILRKLPVGEGKERNNYGKILNPQDHILMDSWTMYCSCHFDGREVLVLTFADFKQSKSQTM